MEIKKKIRNTILISLFLISAIIAGIVLLLRNLSKSAADLFLEKENLLVLNLKNDHLRDFRTNYSELSEDLEKIDALFIDFEAPVDFFAYLERSALSFDVKIKISPRQSKKEKDKWSFHVFQITAEGSSQNLLKFLDSIEKSLYLTEFQNLNFQPNSASGNVGPMKADFELKVYAK